MALPRKFRRPRLALIGFGDVARRIVALRSRLPGAAGQAQFLAIGRSAAPPVAKPRAGTAPSRERGHLDRALPSESPPVRYLRWDMDDRESRRRLSRLMTCCIVLMPPSDQGNADRRSARLACAIRSATPRMPGVYISTTGVYGDYAGNTVTETSPCRPANTRSTRRLSAERIWRRPLGFHVLRVPGIYAEDRLPVERLTAQQPALSRNDDVYTNHIHADDLARIAYAALFRGKMGRITNAVDQGDMKMADYFDAVADALRLPRPPRISRKEMDALAKSGAIGPMMAGFLSESRRVKTERLAPELRIRLGYPTVADTLTAYSTSSRTVHHR